ncbi:hypothetical protein RJ640_016717 [Escallonia rubra]|uniref:Protein FAR1-RELATED SEQUENCE n=1 Tax=Escallonia rubra TaxID=112253 RepID=A0AA88R806_9ASTE|nr:hypothetical protein RJ640_016717 [Escallonia rubra]
MDQQPDVNEQEYDLLLQDRRYTELKSEFKMRQISPVPVANVEMLRHVVEVYTPEMFNIFQYEYTKVWDCSIHKVSKSEKISNYKVICGGRGREHLVKFEAETTTVQCSCMKVNFVGIVCRHALKVHDKENIKRIPPQYVLKRWTKDAKDAIVSDYRSAQVQGKSQESIGKRYSNLSYHFQELVTLAAENEDMYIYAHKNLSKLLKDLEEMKKTYYSNILDLDTTTQDDLPRNVPQLNDGVVSQCPRGIKKKLQSDVHGTSNNGRGSQQKRRKIGQSEYQEEHSDKEDEISTVVYSNINDEHDITNDTLPLQTQVQYPLISSESQELSNDYTLYLPSILILVQRYGHVVIRPSRSCFRHPQFLMTLYNNITKRTTTQTSNTEKAATRRKSKGPGTDGGDAKTGSGGGVDGGTGGMLIGLGGGGHFEALVDGGKGGGRGAGGGGGCGAGGGGVGEGGGGAGGQFKGVGGGGGGRISQPLGHA